ncbi:hypothetical protein ACKWTF_010215 [Chironomus riparius]
MNCMSVQHDKKTFQRNHHQQIITADKHNTSTSSTTSRVGLRSCLRGGIEIEEAESESKSKTLPRIYIDETEDTSYEKACRRGSAPSTPMLTQKPESSTSRFTIFFSKRSNPLKRTKSVTKLERTKRGNGSGGGIRGSRSHESLLSNHAVMSTIDLSVIGAVGVAPVHSSVLGRRHCFQVRGGPRGERYYSCGSRQERDLWIYSLRKSIQPNAESIRRTDNSLKMWIYEGKALPPKKKYFCEICLDKTLYGRTSVKLRTDLLFWGEHFDFPDIPEINVIYVNVFRECEKKKKRDKHVLVGTVKIPIHEVTSRTFSEDWYPIIADKHDSLSKNSTKEPIPTLRIKCRFQSIDILPIDVYSPFQAYLKEHYKKICECLEPVIGVKAKEDIGQALVLQMHHQGMAAEFLTEIITLDLLRVGDQRLTFRGNSLATKSMEAFLKLTGEQYLQDTLSAPINEIIASERDCEVDPLKASGSLSRQQQSLRSAVKLAWNAIYDSHRQFPSQLRECFATFRERLLNINREDMADNLISASIFLRFLCPSILSPSLFNITNELPSQRATRNLTLVAKTLQTLANFTRFQGKENFMEFLNDFLEQEAPRMKDFLNKISSRAELHHNDTILEWSGYIDQGKQLSVLHSLLTENLPKLPPQKQNEMTQLTSILDRVSQIKESTENNYQRHLSEQNFQSMDKLNGRQPSMSSLHGLPSQPNPERGIIRGVLTPNSLQKNIFCYNDPTVYSLLNGEQKMSFNPLQHSHSTSSIQSSHLHNNSIMNNANSIQHHNITSTKRDNYYQITSSLARNEPKSPASSSMRASTLPRNNQQIQNDETNIIQIGLDPSNPFSRKSPTPRMHQGLLTTANTKAQPSVYTNGRQLNGSQLSLISDRSQNQYYHIQQQQHHIQRTNALNLGIPHTEAGSSSYESPNSNMPRDLEDFDDLIKYSEEMEQRQQKIQDPSGIHHHPNLKAKGSNVSIGHSSGYQSIQTQSQSSSPIENVIITSNGHPNVNAQSIIQQNIEFFNAKIQNSSSSSNASTTTRPTKLNGKYGYISPKYSVNPPLAFKNPLYQLQNGTNIDAKSSSLTPSSSEERITIDDRQNVLNNNNLVSSSTNVPGVIDTSSLNGRRMGSNRMPRTNPLVQYKRDDGIYDNHHNNNNNNNIPNINNNNNNQLAYFNNRYERRLSVESARTLSDSSSDTEVHHHKEGKRRRNMNKSSIEQCEKEIHRLQSSVDILRQKLEESELKETSDSIDALANQSDSKIRSIISRLLAMEEELRREQYKMSLIINHKQRVIEAQGQQIAELDAANNRLLSELTCLRNRYEMKNGTFQEKQVLAVTEDDDTTNF